jgi:alkylated DNA repair dioxygenase AlkB
MGPDRPPTAPPPGLALLEEWITADEERALLAAIEACPWRDDLARRVQHHGWRYDYRARAVDGSMRLGPLPAWAEGLARRMQGEGLCDAAPDQVIVNEYEPGQGIARHTDCVPCFGPTVLSLSLASACVMNLYAPRATTPQPVVLRARSLLVLAGPARSAWAHSISKNKNDVIDGIRVARSRRVSVTFRTVRLSGGVSGGVSGGP